MLQFSGIVLLEAEVSINEFFKMLNIARFKFIVIKKIGGV